MSGCMVQMGMINEAHRIFEYGVVDQSMSDYINIDNIRTCRGNGVTASVSMCLGMVSRGLVQQRGLVGKPLILPPYRYLA